MFMEIQGLKKSFGSGSNKVTVLKGIDFSLERGEFCVLLGPSGSGKSTLLNIIGGIDTPDRGAVIVNGEKTYIKIGISENIYNGGSSYAFYDMVRIYSPNWCCLRFDGS